MIALSAATRVFVALEPVDLRQGFNGLSAWVKNQLQADPSNGHLFIFTNQRRNRVKVLYWDGSGLWLCVKRLEKGTFFWPQGAEGPTAILRPEELHALLHGMQMSSRPGWLRR